MWLLGILLILSSAFLFANEQRISDRIKHGSTTQWLVKALAGGFLIIGAYLNNRSWGVESGISLTIAGFGFAMLMCIYFKLASSSTSKKNG